MKLLVLEYITAGGLAGGALTPSLEREGDLMLQTLLNDLLEVSGIELKIMRDCRLPALDHSLDTVWIESPEEFEYAWQAALSMADACWLIAPETDGILERLTRQAEATGVMILGCSSEAVAVSSSQSQSNHVVKKNSVPVISDFILEESMIEAWVVKPDRGAGGENFHFFSNRQQASDWVASQVDPALWIQQPWITGESLSLCLLCKTNEAIVLSVNRQQFNRQDNEGLSLVACHVNVEPASDEIIRIVNKTVQAVPGLWGYVGIDLLRTSAGLVFVEINPRLTTSYAGLHKATGINPASQVLSLLTEPLPSSAVEYSPAVVKVAVKENSHVH